MARDEDGRVGKLVQFTTEDRLVLDGFLAGPRKSTRCIIYVHGMTGTFYGAGKTRWEVAGRTRRAGFSFFSMNTRGHAAVAFIGRKGRGRERLAAGTWVERFEDSVLDIDGAIRRLREMGFSEFILAGSSTGCQKIIYYQYKRANRAVKGLLLLAPTDDYAAQLKELGRRFDPTVRLCRRLVREGMGDEPSALVPYHFSPRRFLSVSDLRNPEARIFHYGGTMREFSTVFTPVCAVFGRREEHATMPVTEYLKILRSKKRKGGFVGVVVDGAGHSFDGRAEILGDFVLRWIKSLGNRKEPMREIVELHPKFPLALLGYS